MTELPGPLAQRGHLVAHVRRLLHLLATTTATDGTLDEASLFVEQAVGLLAASPREAGHVRRVEGALHGLGTHGELGPFTGRLHPFAPTEFAVSVAERLEGHLVNARVRYGDAHEGAPGLVHGGFIAATFDEMLGRCQAGQGRMTASMEVSYHAPTPLHEQLDYSAEVERIEGRKAFVRGTLHWGATPCATARGLFIAPRSRGYVT